jgi:hypothetical protein
VAGVDYQDGGQVCIAPSGRTYLSGPSLSPSTGDGLSPAARYLKSIGADAPNAGTVEAQVGPVIQPVVLSVFGGAWVRPAMVAWGSYETGYGGAEVQDGKYLEGSLRIASGMGWVAGGLAPLPGLRPANLGDAFARPALSPVSAANEFRLPAGSMVEAAASRYAIGDASGTADIGVPATRSANPLSPVLEYDAHGNEIYYRAMKESHYKTLAEDGVLTGTGETSLAPLKAYSAGYKGALVRLTVKPGTSAQLQEIGIAANEPAAAEFPGMSTGIGPWNQTSARFKVEATGVMNINSGLGIMNTQLGKGRGLDIFNANLLDFERLN